MWWPGVRIFRLSSRDKQLDAHHLASGKAAIALGRKVLTDNPRPNVPAIGQQESKNPPRPKPPLEPRLEPRDGSQTRMAADRKTKARERRSIELQHLSLADKHLAKAERVVREQGAIIRGLRDDGHDTKLAEDTMRVFEANLQVMREHRELIVRAIEEAG